jgi:hypothetical protein
MSTDVFRQRTILKGIIEDSLRSFPEDAHQKVLQFLLDAGLDEAQSLRFRQAWSKVVLGAQAFGRNTKQKVDIPLFSEELIRELSYSDDVVTKLINSSEACLKLDHHRESLESTNQAATRQDAKNPRDTIAALEAVTAMGADLARVLANIYTSSDTHAEDKGSRNTANTQLFESIGLFRKSLRGTKLRWGGSVLPADVLYIPLDSTIHGLPDVVKGKLDMQLRTDRQDLNVYMGTDELIGLSVSSRQPVHQERGWVAYQCLNELLSSHGLNLFPLPVGVHREASNLATIFAFESAADCVPLSSLYGPALSTYLRRTPQVMHRWCAQLSRTYRSLLACSGSLMKSIRVDSDVFVRENGHLLVGNVAFEAVRPALKGGYGRGLLSVYCELLARTLCVSRTESVQLREVHGADLDRDDAIDGDAAGDGADRGNKVEEEDRVLAVVVGSTLELLVSGHGCTAVQLQDGRAASNASAGVTATAAAGRAGLRASHGGASAASLAAGSAPAKEEENSASKLYINIAVSQGAYTDYLTATVTQPESAGKPVRLVLNTTRPGVLSLHMSARVADSDSGGAGLGDKEGRYRHRGCRLRVVVIPNYPVESVSLQDLVGHLEECHAWGNPEILLHSQLFASPSAEEGEGSGGAQGGAAGAGAAGSGAGNSSPGTAAVRSQQASLMHDRDVQRGWQDIKRVITNHGTLHTPKV